MQEWYIGLFSHLTNIFRLPVIYSQQINSNEFYKQDLLIEYTTNCRREKISKWTNFRYIYKKTKRW